VVDVDHIVGVRRVAQVPDRRGEGDRHEGQHEGRNACEHPHTGTPELAHLPVAVEVEAEKLLQPLTEPVEFLFELPHLRGQPVIDLHFLLLVAHGSSPLHGRFAPADFANHGGPARAFLCG
jgi:hypothetical protein